MLLKVQKILILGFLESHFDTFNWSAGKKIPRHQILILTFIGSKEECYE